MAEDNDKDKGQKTAEEELAELKTKMTELTAEGESAQAELARLRKDKDALLKDLKKVKDEREALRKAQMSEEERKAAEGTKVSELEAILERERAEALRYKILSTTNHGLDPAFARLVEGTDESSILASIEAVRAEQAEAAKRLAPPGSPGTAPPPPDPAGGRPPTLTEKDIWNMTPEQMAEFEHKVKTGEAQLSSE